MTTREQTKINELARIQKDFQVKVQMDLVTIKKESRAFRNEVRSDVKDIKDALDLMVPRKWFSTFTNVMKWLIVTILATLAVIAAFMEAHKR